MKIVGEYPLPPPLRRCERCGAYLWLCPFRRKNFFVCPDCDCRKCPRFPCPVWRPIGEHPIPPLDRIRVRVVE